LFNDLAILGGLFTFNLLVSSKSDGDVLNLTIAIFTDNMQPSGIATYYRNKIDSVKIQLHDKLENLRRLEAQRNDLNAKGESQGSDQFLALFIASLLIIPLSSYSASFEK
jgi:hypothetical protein